MRRRTSWNWRRLGRRQRDDWQHVRGRVMESEEEEEEDEEEERDEEDKLKGLSGLSAKASIP